MNPAHECPICGLASQQIEESDGGNRKNVRCQRCGDFEITIAAARTVESSELAAQLSAWIRDHKEFGRPPPEITREYLDEILSSIPTYGVSDKQRILLRALERRSNFPGDHVEMNLELDFPVVWASKPHEFEYLLRALTDRRLVGAPGGFNNILCTFVISPSGWNYLDELSQSAGNGNQAFVAMWFSRELIPVWEDGIKPALERAQFCAYRVDADPKNIDRIDAKIMMEIKNSRFIVADVTGQRQGVYYEAGYAMGLGLRVIWSVREDDLKNVHFDTRQYNHIVWNTADDLQEQLYNRVSAVIGRPGD